ncbi:MAG: replication initiation protein [Roseivirga sp.]
MNSNMAYASDLNDHQWEAIKDHFRGKTRSELQKTLFGDKIVKIPTKSLMPPGSQNYSVVKKALKSLGQKTMVIRSRDKYGSYETTVRLIMKSKYYLNNEMVEIQLDRDILPDYLSLASYSKYMVEISMASSSRYVMRLYQFISHWRDKTKKVVTLEELRDTLELGEKYEKPKDLRKFILEPSIKDLKDRADVWFEIDKPIKSGRSITGYIFNIYKRNYNRHNASAHEQNITDTLKTLFGLRSYHLDQLREIINKAELHPHIYQKIQEIEFQVSKGKVERIQPYVVQALKNEFESDNDKVYKVPVGTREQLEVSRSAEQLEIEQEKARRARVAEEPTREASGLISDYLRKLAQKNDS